MASIYHRADIYDLFDNEEKYQAMKKHWETVLDGTGVKTLLDVSIGTGGLTLPAAELGVSLYGSDLSKEMLKKCKGNAAQRGIPIDLRACDFRELTGQFQETFGCVASTGNSLPHVTNEELDSVLGQMDLLVEQGGYLYFDMRNWDKILEERNRFYLYDPVFVEDMRVNLVQVWDYHADGAMTFHLLYTFERDQKTVQKEVFEEQYYPVSRERLVGKLESLGYQDIRLMCHPAYFDKVDPKEVDWYCVMAKKA